MDPRHRQRVTAALGRTAGGRVGHREPGRFQRAQHRIVERPKGVGEDIHGVPEHPLEHVPRAGDLGVQLARGQQPQVDVMRGVIADVHPGLVELTDLIGGEEARLGHPTGDHEERAHHVEALERWKDRPDVVDVAVVDGDDHRFGGQRVALVEGVEQLPLVNRVVTVGLQRREFGDERRGLDLQVGDSDRGQGSNPAIGEYRDVHRARGRPGGRDEDRHRSMRHRGVRGAFAAAGRQLPAVGRRARTRAAAAPGQADRGTEHKADEKPLEIVHGRSG